MYLDYLVDVPDEKGKITFREKGNTKYVYYEYERVYGNQDTWLTPKFDSCIYD